MLGGIGFTMSIFITNLAFTGNPAVTNASKMAILLASLAAGIAGFMWLRIFGKPAIAGSEADTMAFEDSTGAGSEGK
jgi:NhaA family Na+:H+ antiporter